MGEIMIIVVEGKNDANKIKSIFNDAHVIITNGSEINMDTIMDIKKASEFDEVILCLDPDGPGEKIRRKIVEFVPNVSHVFAIKEKAISSNKKKIGIEHMSKEGLLELFSDVKCVKKEKNITYVDLYNMGLMNNKAKRVKLCKALNISYCNGKQLLKRINMFGITMEEIKKYDC